MSIPGATAVCERDCTPNPTIAVVRLSRPVDPFMNAIGIIDHQHVRHVIMAGCLCVAVITFFASIVVITLMGYACLRPTTPYSRVINRLKVVLALAAVTGLLGSVPFAWATCSHTVVSFLARDLAYAGVIALGTLFFAALVAGIATSPIESGDYEVPHNTGMFDRGTLFRINPSSGLPMYGALDVAGNVYGHDSHSRLHHTIPML